jgi:hypothetical protein
VEFKPKPRTILQFQNPIDEGAANLETPGDFARPYSLVNEITHGRAIDRRFAPLVDIFLGFCPLDSIALTGLDEAKLQFRHHPQHRQDHFPHWSIGGNGGFENTQECAFLVELVNEIKDVSR